MSFARELTEQIKAQGPITVAEYIARCNTHYYATRDPLGAQGDFTTAPEISQIFGELIGAWIADQWQQLGSPQAILCEPGPGRGTLMKDLLRATRLIPGFHDAVQVQLIETSPRLKTIQQGLLKDAHPHIGWANTLDVLPPRPLLLVANEFFDALPAEQFVKEGLVEKERRVSHDGDRLVFMPQGSVMRETSRASLALMGRIAAHIHAHGGAALIVDYGHDGGTPADTLQAVRNHRYADALAHPGEADLTTHVDFAALAAAARKCGAYAYGTAEQGTFLKRLGAELRAAALCKSAAPEQQKTVLQGLERLVAPQEMGTLFKALAVTSLQDKPAGF